MINVFVLNELKEMATSSHDTVLEKLTELKFEKFEKFELTVRKQKSQSKCSDEHRYAIAKYAKYNGASQAATFFKNKYPTINESTRRTFVKNYDKNVKVAKACVRSPDRKLNTLMLGRSLMVGPIIGEKLFMVSLKKEVMFSRSIAATTAVVLLSRMNGESVKNVVVTTTWGKGQSQRIGF